MARKCARLSHKKDHAGSPQNRAQTHPRGLETPAGYPPKGPQPPVPPDLGFCELPRAPKAALGIARVLVVKKKRGLGVGKADPNWAGFPPESTRACGKGR